jgi:hypothetical protein
VSGIYVAGALVSVTAGRSYVSGGKDFTPWVVDLLVVAEEGAKVIHVEFESEAAAKQATSKPNEKGEVMVAVAPRVVAIKDRAPWIAYRAA